MSSPAELFLVVSNPEQLIHGSQPLVGPVAYNSIIVIGSGTAADWRLRDAHGEVHPSHAAVQTIDNCYVLVDLCGYTYINHHRDPLGKMHVVALNDGDSIQIGKYRIKALIDDDHAIDSDSIPATQGVGHLSRVQIERLFGAGNALDDFIHGTKMPALTHTTAIPTTNELDIWLQQTRPRNALEQFLQQEEDKETRARYTFAEPLNSQDTDGYIIDSEELASLSDAAVSNPISPGTASQTTQTNNIEANKTVGMGDHPRNSLRTLYRRKAQ